MPRILPRLLEALARKPLGPEIYHGPLTQPHQRRRSLWKPHKPTPSFSISNRSHSILLDLSDSSSYREEFARHKTLPPMVKFTNVRKSMVVDSDHSREMTEQERSWWSSPYRKRSENWQNGTLLQSQSQLECCPHLCANAS